MSNPCSAPIAVFFSIPRYPRRFVEPEPRRKTMNAVTSLVRWHQRIFPSRTTGAFVLAAKLVEELADISIMFLFSCILGRHARGKILSIAASTHSLLSASSLARVPCSPRSQVNARQPPNHPQQGWHCLVHTTLFYAQHVQTRTRITQ